MQIKSMKLQLPLLDFHFFVPYSGCQNKDFAETWLTLRPDWKSKCYSFMMVAKIGKLSMANLPWDLIETQFELLQVLKLPDGCHVVILEFVVLKSQMNEGIFETLRTNWIGFTNRS